jgi:hypothetical protein
MAGQLTRMDVNAAREDLQYRTLAGIGLEFAQLIYLASTRDYNTGRYYHDGLAFHFSPEVAGQALAEAHKDVFVDLALKPLEDLVGQLEVYLRSVSGAPKEIIRAWEKLEPYRVAIPLGCDPLTAGFFLANLKIALAIVESRQ